ncbi:MAG: hypothetical protein NWF04_10435 [Candidatus Bathyarchaeota archaeon]|nr:hypothetical protein [Candidatus Bathyarchaeota archaeon]
MSSKFPISYMEIRVTSHATEDLEKVQTAVCNTLPETLTEDLTFNKVSLTGHHGNPIVLVSTKLSDRTTLPCALEKFAQDLNTLDKDALADEILHHIEKHNLYLRFDKQAAFCGALKLASNDPIHFKIHFKNKTPQEIQEICRQKGLLP